MTQRLILVRPDDWHLHLRDGAMLEAVLLHNEINQINAAARSGCRSVEAIGVALNAGTNCGSCRPEIRRILDATQPIAAE